MIALIIAETGFLMHLKKKPHYTLRMFMTITACLFIVIIFPLLNYNAVYSSFMFTVFFIITIPMAKICYDIRWRSCIFCTVAGYCIQHLASVFNDIIITLSGLEHQAHVYSDDAYSPHFLIIFINLQVYLFVYWCLLHYFGRRIKKEDDITIQNPSLMIIVAVTVLVEIVLNAFVTYRRYENLDFVYYLTASVTNILCSLMVLEIQFSLVLQKSLKDELNVVYQMWHQEQKQYYISRDTIDLINMKCHDMKHQIHNIGTTGAIDPAALKEMEDTISIYDSFIKTGNQALDIILAEKSLYCQKNNIFISYIIDGEKLNFMNDTDIYSLFGNLLDNAIQTVIGLDKEKRIIGLTIRAEGELLSMNTHNYYDGEIQISNGIPISGKKDKDYHGFGFKSMSMIVEKYDGNLSFEAKEQIFNLNILFPISTSLR